MIKNKNEITELSLLKLKISPTIFLLKNLGRESREEGRRRQDEAVATKARGGGGETATTARSGGGDHYKGVREGVGRRGLYKITSKKSA